MNKVDCKIGIEDLTALKNINNSIDKQDSQRYILDILNHLSNIINDYLEKEELFIEACSLRRNFAKKTILNYIKAMGTGALTTIVAEYGLDFDSNIFLDIIATTVAGTTGFVLFQRELMKEEDHITNRELLEVSDSFDEVFVDTWKTIFEYANMKNNYLKKYHRNEKKLDWDEELYSIFYNNFDYIMDNEEFSEEFTYYNTINTLSQFFDEEGEKLNIMNKKSKKRKL